MTVVEHKFSTMNVSLKLLKRYSALRNFKYSHKLLQNYQQRKTEFEFK